MAFFANKQSAGSDLAPKSLHAPCDVKKSAKRTTSCPPGRAHSASAGPWSLEWVNRRKIDFNEVVRPPKINSRQSNSSGVPRVTKKKGSGYLRHCAHNLKPIVRLSNNDCKEVFRALQKTRRRRKEVFEVSKDKVTVTVSSSLSRSQASVNNDWTHWLALHGSDKNMSNDVKGIGKKLGLNFKGDKNNMFDVLSGVGRKNS